ncbi:hypothetical protein N7495_007742 [Penicillium taxi]|uniref:uncharacterized protein n=1 Tax=Penicillium taxi TaxID=168475 RepID=UPI0025454DB4|nr:uncharacterized protein N7495_007742 [Penicillium taxi]KAJ5887701.1 hypothetical protein N7495_007742 [Penicillium taxi]
MGDGKIKGNLISKEPDWSIRPDENLLPPGRDSLWPELVLETGVSESLSELMKDARFWLSNSIGDMKMVLVISVNSKVPHIRYRCVVVSSTSVGRNGCVQYVYSTRHEMEQTRDATGAVVTTNGPITIHFDELFLRPPVAPEADITLDSVNLDRMARSIWNSVLKI